MVVETVWPTNDYVMSPPSTLYHVPEDINIFIPLQPPLRYLNSRLLSLTLVRTSCSLYNGLVLLNILIWWLLAS